MNPIPSPVAGPRFAPAWAGAILICALAGCLSNKYVIELDHRFSYNLAPVPSWFPGNEKSITPIQQQTFRRYGSPDFIRFWWTTDGQIITSSDLSGKGDQFSEMMAQTKRTWIYLHPEKEIEFTTDGRMLEHPLTDTIKLIAHYGDPNVKQAPKVDKEGRKKETWIWYEHGLKIEMLDAHEISRSYFTPTGRGTWAGK